jgi:hypothetical protein
MIVESQPEDMILMLANFFVVEKSTMREVPIEIVQQLLVLLELELIKRKGAIH